MIKRKKGRPKIYLEPLKRQYLVLPERQYRYFSEKAKLSGISINRQIVDVLEKEITLNHRIKNK